METLTLDFKVHFSTFVIGKVESFLDNGCIQFCYILLILEFSYYIVYLEQKVADTEKKMKETQQKMEETTQALERSQREQEKTAQDVVESRRKLLVLRQDVHDKEQALEQKERMIQLERQQLKRERQLLQQERQMMRNQEQTPKAEIYKQLHEIEKENRRLRMQRLCKICMEKEVQVVFIPCGHLVSCQQCAQCLTDENLKCPMCRENIEGKVRVFFN